MITASFDLLNCAFEATATRALYWPDERLIVVSDLHLGKAERIARRSGLMLPPYETQDTLHRLAEVIAFFNPRCVVCLGDSFDDLDACQNLGHEEVDHIHALMAGRDWVWIEGNHDPAPVGFGGQHLAEFHHSQIAFRHIADPVTDTPEISGHYHPKAKIASGGRSMTRPCFLYDKTRAIMPSFGTYTGGLFSTDPIFGQLMGHDARAILTGVAPHIIPMPR